MRQFTLATSKTATDNCDRYTLLINGKDTKYIVTERYKDGSVRWFPFRYYQGYSDPLKRYKKIEFIGTTYGKIPKTGFSTNLYSGCGFTKDQGMDRFFRFVEESVKTNIRGVMFTNDKSYIKNDILYIYIKDFSSIKFRSKLQIESKKKEQVILFAKMVFKLFPKEIQDPGKFVYTPGTLNNFISKYAEDTIRLNNEDAESIVDKLDIDKQLIISTKKKIDKKYIEEVVEEFKKLIQQKTDSKRLEERWHQFFKRNPWIFSNVFAYPISLFEDKLNVGGHNISGGTDKIVDFIYKNKLTKNIAFIEIKTHLTNLISRTPYRRPNIYSISKDMSGSIVQVIDQKMTLLKNYHSIKGNDGTDSLNSNCLVVVGHTSQLDTKGKNDSFELFRLSSRDVSIVTFDEVQEKMETLLKIFTK
jgi:hypothetical protein